MTFAIVLVKRRRCSNGRFRGKGQSTLLLAGEAAVLLSALVCWLLLHSITSSSYRRIFSRRDGTFHRLIVESCTIVLSSVLLFLESVVLCVASTTRLSRCCCCCCERPFLVSVTSDVLSRDCTLSPFANVLSHGFTSVLLSRDVFSCAVVPSFRPFLSHERRQFFCRCRSVTSQAYFSRASSSYFLRIFR